MPVIFSQSFTTVRLEFVSNTTNFGFIPVGSSGASFSTLIVPSSVWLAPVGSTGAGFSTLIVPTSITLTHTGSSATA